MCHDQTSLKREHSETILEYTHFLKPTQKSKTKKPELESGFFGDHHIELFRRIKM